MASDPTRAPDHEPTRVSPSAGDATDAPTPPTDAPTPPAGTPSDAAGTSPDAPEDVVTDAPLWPDPSDVPPPTDEPAGKRRGRSAADRTAGGAKVAADRVSQAASATAQALRETDVSEIARNTTKLIENTRPFFLAAFAIVFTFLASVENHAAVGVVFAVAAVLCVLGAAFSPAVDQTLKRRDRR